MKRFQYKAKTDKGKVVKGLVEATDKSQVAQILREKSLTPFLIQEKGKDNLSSFIAVFQGVSSKDIVSFTRQLAIMVNAGLSLTNSLIILQEQAKPAFAKILADVVKEIEGGSSLYDALGKHPKYFNKIYLALIKSGEASGALDEVLKNMADSLEKQQEFKGKIKGAMIYPMLVVTGMIGVIFIMMVFVIPKLTTMYEDFGTTLPIATRILIGTSKFASKFWFIVIGAVIGLIYVYKTYSKTPLGRKQIDQLILKLPVVGILKSKMVLTEITRTLSMLLSAGVTIIESLNIVEDAADNAVFENSIRQAAKEVEKGLPLAATFSRYEEYPPLFSQMIAVGEETGKLDEVLLRLSKQFEMESETAIKSLTTAIEPLMMVVLGVGVGFIVFAIITPIYNLTSQF